MLTCPKAHINHGQLDSLLADTCWLKAAANWESVARLSRLRILVICDCHILSRTFSDPTAIGDVFEDSWYPWYTHETVAREYPNTSENAMFHLWCEIYNATFKANKIGKTCLCSGMNWSNILARHLLSYIGTGGRITLRWLVVYLHYLYTNDCNSFSGSSVYKLKIVDNDFHPKKG